MFLAYVSLLPSLCVSSLSLLAVLYVFYLGSYRVHFAFLVVKGERLV